MELFRSSEYTDTNQMIILYVRDINDEYLKQLDVIMRRATDALGMVSLNITKGICIAGALYESIICSFRKEWSVLKIIY